MRFSTSCLTLLLCCTGWMFCAAQIERIHIETYYIADADDATDVSGGMLEEGAVTYRVYADLVQGSKLVAVYGSGQHPLIFNSTLPFFNHQEDGVSFGKDLSRNRYGTGTIPVDTYLALGQISRSFSGSAYFGLPKTQDTDGSIVGGVNNDGGSEGVPGGLLKNEAKEMGIPLTTSDGIEIKSVLPTSWVDIGFIDITTGIDTTMFGSALVKNGFYSTNAVLRNSGVFGVDIEKNEVLIGQFTTKGELSFELNLEVELPLNGSGKIIRYVARNEFLADDEVFLPILKYPYACGCTDPAFLEADPTFGCTDNSKCLTPVVLGCMDTMACNYNPDANLNIQDICCYIGYCNNLDISIACPDLEPRQDFSVHHVRLLPNPVMDEAILSIDFVLYADIACIVTDISGKPIFSHVLKGGERRLDFSYLSPGYYVIKLEASGQTMVLPFVKM